MTPKEAAFQRGVEAMRTAAVERLERAARDWKEAADDYIDDLTLRDTLHTRNMERMKTCQMYAECIGKLEVKP